MKYSGIGGQAVIEGVMMRGTDKYAVAIRKPDKEIEIKVKSGKRFSDQHSWARIPVIRGVVAFVESLALGMGTLNYSASFFEEEEEKEEKKQKTEEEKKKDAQKDSVLMGIVLVAAVLIAISLFVMLPFFISEALRKQIPSAQLRGLLEGVIRVALFLIYVKLISRMEDIKRVFMYHGAEHKSINCLENGCELTVENVRRQNTQHKRCGTSFLLVVMFVSILFFMFITLGNIWLRMIARILLIPAIAGVSYEFIRFAGTSKSKVADVLSRPGLWLQSLTTAEPTDDMIEVAIASVNAVFDWKEFLAGYAEEEKISKDKAKEKKSREKKTKERQSREKKDEKRQERKKVEKDPAGEEKREEKEIIADPTKVSLVPEKDREAKEKVSSSPALEESAPAKEELLQKETKPPVPAEKTEVAKEEKPEKEKPKQDIEILRLDDDEEDDEILSALDRYFESPEEE